MMSDLSPNQQEQAVALLERKQRRLRLRKSNYEDGGVERELSSFFSGIAGDAKTIGILEVGVGDLEDAREAFADATDYYQRSAEEDVFPLHSTRQRTQGMYTALLAGATDDLVAIAESMIRLAGTEDCTPGDDNSDRYFLAWCLAGAVLGDIDDAALDGLEESNQSKPDKHSDYGHAVLSVVRGLRDDDSAALQTGIESMLSFHQQDSHQDNIVDQVMSVQTTALLVLVRARGDDLTVESPYIPEDLVQHAAEELDL